MIRAAHVCTKSNSDMTAATAKPSGRSIYLDLFKFFLCYMVICIHLVGETYAVYPLYRLSVPMFFSYQRVLPVYRRRG